jgi:hypothetical protein
LLAYISWHTPAGGADTAAYEQALERFHRSLAHRPPSGLRGSAVFRSASAPWSGAVAAEHVYEDWYLLDGWSSVGVLEEAAVAQGHTTAHHGVAAMAGTATSSIYRLSEGGAHLADARVAVWVSRGRGHPSPTLADLLGDGMDGESAGLWRRCLGLGPAPEHCLLAGEPSPGVSATRLPEGWEATVSEREVLWHG